MLGKKIKEIAKSDRVLFTTPSHDRTSFVIPEVSDYVGRKFFHNDLSEINDLDNLAAPEAEILYSMQNAASLIGVEDLFYLINGSSSGIVAAMLSVLKDKDKVLIARNCHKSVLNGLVLTGAEPFWITPEIDEDWAVFKGLSPKLVEEKLSLINGIKAVIITSPTYEGIDSDIFEISNICHKYGVLLIVDEAHGALKSFAPKIFGQNAVQLGADICVQSLHKTCGAPNPCAILLSNGVISRDKIQNSLNLINTSSPSYPMLAAIEKTITFLLSKDGQEKIKKLCKDIDELKSAFENEKEIEFCKDNDLTKIMVKINGLSGFVLSDILFDEFNIEDELCNNFSSLLLTGIGTTKHKLKQLEKALKVILSTEYRFPQMRMVCPISGSDYVMTPREACFSNKVKIPLSLAEGRVCAEIITEYPPGIPIVVLGERITREQVEYLLQSRKLIEVVG